MCNTYTDCDYGRGICHQMGCEKFQDDCGVEMVVMQQLITQDMDFCQEVTVQLSAVVGTVWKSSGIVVQ